MLTRHTAYFWHMRQFVPFVIIALPNKQYEGDGVDLLGFSDIIEVDGMQWLVVPALPQIIDFVAALGVEREDVEPEDYE
jgi:hypothetical protein